MCDTSMMPFRVAIPNSVMKPTIDATDRTPPATIHAEHAADQRERQIQHDHHASRDDRTPPMRMKKNRDDHSSRKPQS